jgi:hypothetical protein
MKDSRFLDLIRSLPRRPKHSLVFVIDALDKCGNTQSRPGILKVLKDVVAHAPWLSIIITSGPEVGNHWEQGVRTLAPTRFVLRGHGRLG